MIKMNNIILQHDDIKISIAQHRSTSDSHGRNTKEMQTLCQEVAVLPNCDIIHNFDGTLDSLINVLTTIKEGLS